MNNNTPTQHAVPVNNKPSTNYSAEYARVTAGLDETATVQFQWLIYAIAGMGIPSVTQRRILTRAIDVYTRLIEESVASWNSTHNDESILYERAMLNRVLDRRAIPANTLEIGAHVYDDAGNIRTIKQVGQYMAERGIRYQPTQAQLQLHRRTGKRNLLTLSEITGGVADDDKPVRKQQQRRRSGNNEH
jgi:hypothetical protein